MKFFTAALFLFCSFPFSVFAAEQVDSFVSDIHLNTDGTFEVTETIAYDFDASSRHGIYRYIDTKHPQRASSFWKERFEEVSFQEVTQDGNPVPFVITNSSAKDEVKIGDPSVTISGKHVYVIKYKVKGGYSFFDDKKAELYWNVTGNGWEVPILFATAHVFGPLGSMTGNSSCYKGILGSAQKCDTIQKLQEGEALFSTAGLGSGEGFTLAQELDGSMISHVVLERIKLFSILLPTFLVLLIGLSIFGYRYRTKYRTGGPVIAQYEPYKDFKPMYAGLLFDGRLDARDITAGMVYLAQQGFIKISKIEKKVLFLFEVDDYRIDLLKPVTEAESVFLSDVLCLLFSSSAIAGDSITLGDLRSDTEKQKENALRLVELRKELKKDMQASGFFQYNSTALWLLGVSSGILFFSLFIIDQLMRYIPSLLLVLCAVMLFSCFIAGALMYQRRTKLGYEALYHLKGFKLFLSVTDKERFAFHDAPQKSPEQFMEYLPYAIAFGVEKQWAKVFEGITMPNPRWYDGGSAGAFSAVNLTSSLSAFSTSFASSSGSSASSGGGSSGGGGGGGGGGSW